MKPITFPSRSVLIMFVLLTASEVLGATCQATRADVEGPFYLPGTPFREEIAPLTEPGERLHIRGKILSDNCVTPLEGALIEVWHTDIKGNYKGKTEGERFRGRIRSSKDGEYRFNTIVPGRYRLGKSYRPAHIHFRISHPGYKTLITQLYFQGDPYLSPNDACSIGCRSDDPERIIELQKSSQGFQGSFPVILNRIRK